MVGLILNKGQSAKALPVQFYTPTDLNHRRKNRSKGFNNVSSANFAFHLLKTKHLAFKRHGGLLYQYVILVFIICFVLKKDKINCLTALRDFYLIMYFRIIIFNNKQDFYKQVRRKYIDAITRLIKFLKIKCFKRIF